MKKKYIQSFVKITTLILGLFLSNSSLNAATQTLSVNSSGVVVNTNPNITFTNNVTGLFSGNGTGLTNLNIVASGGIVNGTASQYWGAYSTVNLVGFNTNNFDAINMFQHPQAGGHYVFSKLYGCYTNSANTNNLFYFNNQFFGWEFGTNSGDSDGSHAYYSDGGSTPNHIPTNNTTIWYEGNLLLGTIQPIPSCVAIGNLATSNNPIVKITPTGLIIVNLDNNAVPFNVHSNLAGNNLYDEYYEVSAHSFDDRVTWYGGPGPTWSNDNNVAHSFAPSIAVWRLNGASTNIPGVDNRGVVQLGSIFGLVVTNSDGSVNYSHIADKGSAFEFLLRNDLTNQTINGTGLFDEPLRLNGDASAWLGDVPTGFQNNGGVIIHGQYVVSPAAVMIFNTTPTRPAFLITSTNIYTGPMTNGGFWNDATYIHLMMAGRDGIPLTGTNSSWNGGSLTNLNAINVTIGTLADARLSANIPRLNTANNFSANQSVNGALVTTNIAASSGSDTNMAAYDSTGTQVKVSINSLVASSGSQTPWTSGINGAGNSISNINNMYVTNLATFGSFETNTMSGIVISAGWSNGVSSTNLPYVLTTRAVSPLQSLPVAVMTPLYATNPMSLDLMPGPGAKDYFGNGVSWIDICSTNCWNTSPTNLATLRLQVSQVTGSPGVGQPTAYIGTQYLNAPAGQFEALSIGANGNTSIYINSASGALIVGTLSINGDIGYAFGGSINNIYAAKAVGNFLSFGPNDDVKLTYTATGVLNNNAGTNIFTGTIFGNGSGVTNTAQNTVVYTNFLFGSFFTNNSTRNELVSVNARCNPTATGNALFAIVTSPTGATYTTNAILGLEADTIFTTGPHSWYQATAQVPPGGIWQVVDKTGEGLVTISNSFYTTLQ